MSKIIKEDVRSIRAINYSPSQHTDRSHSLVNVLKPSNIKNTLNTFKRLHEREASNMSHHQTSKNVVINLIGAGPSTPQNKKNTGVFFNMGTRHSNNSIEPQRSGDEDGSKLYDPLTPKGSNLYVNNSNIQTIEEDSRSISSVSNAENEKSDKIANEIFENTVSSPTIYEESQIKQIRDLTKTKTNQYTSKSHTTSISKNTLALPNL
jgi:hypothetical protein